MKGDLLTIFPGIALETKKWGLGKEVEDPDVFDNLVFKNTHIVSYKKLQFNSNVLDRKYVRYIDDLHNKIIDSQGNQLTDYIIILDKNIDSTTIEPPTPDSQQLITYFSYLQNLDFWICLDFIKIICFHGGGTYIYLNNKEERGPKYSFLLPIVQDHKPKLKLHKNWKKFMDAFYMSMDRDLRSRLINAIALFNESCRINPFSPNSSIVLIVSALESLLNLPRYSKKENFAYALKIFWGFDERIEQWAKELYELRSQIVHGDVVEGERLLTSKDHHYPHFKIARDIFHDCLLFILEGRRYLILDKRYKYEAIRRIRNKTISNKEKVNEIVEQKRKFTYQAFLKNRKLYKEFLVRVETLTPIDFSAQDDVIKLFKLVFTIAEDWIKAEKTRGNHISNDILKKYLKFRNERFDKILILFNDIRQIKWSPKGKFRMYLKIRELEEVVRQLEPIVHSKDEFNFTVPEFLDRCLEAMFAVY